MIYSHVFSIICFCSGSKTNPNKKKQKNCFLRAAFCKEWHFANVKAAFSLNILRFDVFNSCSLCLSLSSSAAIWQLFSLVFNMPLLSLFKPILARWVVVGTVYYYYYFPPILEGFWVCCACCSGTFCILLLCFISWSGSTTMSLFAYFWRWH